MPRTPLPLPSREELCRIFRYDKESGILYRNPDPMMGKGWNTRWANKPTGYTSKTGHMQVGIGETLFLAHRIIWKMETGEEPADIDHKNGDASNNKWKNLRGCTHMNNLQNRRTRKDKILDLPLGVFINKNTGGIYAKFCGNGVQRHLGTFGSIEDAARAYDAYAKDEYGEYARLNYPEDGNG